MAALFIWKMRFNTETETGYGPRDINHAVSSDRFRAIPRAHYHVGPTLFGPASCWKSCWKCVTIHDRNVLSALPAIFILKLFLRYNGSFDEQRLFSVKFARWRNFFDFDNYGQRKSHLKIITTDNIFQQVFTGVPVNINNVITGVPKISNKFSHE